MAEKPMEKNDLSWREKIRYIIAIFRYSKRMAHWKVINCENCGCCELERIGEGKHEAEDGIYTFKQMYRCLNCGFIGRGFQEWRRAGDGRK